MYGLIVTKLVRHELEIKYDVITAPMRHNAQTNVILKQGIPEVTGTLGAATLPDIPQPHTTKQGIG